MLGSTKLCIACAEKIRLEAKLCRYCGTIQNDERFLDFFKIDEVQTSQIAFSEASQVNLEPEVSSSPDLSNLTATCPDNHPVDPTWKFCDECGLEISPAVAPVEEDDVEPLEFQPSPQPLELLSEYDLREPSADLTEEVDWNQRPEAMETELHLAQRADPLWKKRRKPILITAAVSFALVPAITLGLWQLQEKPLDSSLAIPIGTPSNQPSSLAPSEQNANSEPVTTQEDYPELPLSAPPSSEEAPKEKEPSTNDDTVQSEAPSSSEEETSDSGDSGDSTEVVDSPSFTDDETETAYLPPGWSSFPGQFELVSGHDYFFTREYVSASELRDEMRVGSHPLGIGFCERSTNPGLGSYSSYFAGLTRNETYATCSNGRGTTFVFITDEAWIASHWKDLAFDNYQAHWFVGRPLCSARALAVAVLKEEGTPPYIKRGVPHYETDLWPVALALPNWKYIEINGQEQGFKEEVRSCNGDCKEDVLGDRIPDNLCSWR